MKDMEILVLIEKYLNGHASEKEKKLVDDWYDSFEKNPGYPDLSNDVAVELARKKNFLALRKKLGI